MSEPRRQRTLYGRALVGAPGQGLALCSPEPLSFWGGYDYHTGEIIDRRHPLAGQCAAGRVLVLPYSRGSSTTTAVLLEAVRAGTSPAAILTTGGDHFLALASIVADEMYRRPIPVLALEPGDLASIETDQWVEVRPDGTVIVVDLY
jgi:predicted aconitase with swiveling domain